jgi:superfamily II RNA helicase
MSGEGGSDVWEKTMLLINCPMIGLSATVNNGDELCQWIEHVESERSKLFKTSKPRRVRFIVHHERMADLNKYLYTNRQLHPIHPVGVMNAKQLITRGVPKDFSLSPRETLQLHDAMKKVSTDTSVPTLTQFFSPHWVVERNLCNDYSKLIEKKNNSNIDTIATSLQPITSNDIQYPESKAISKLIIEFVLTLKEKDLLPCIVFTDNRKLCEIMAVSVANYFEEHERQLRATKYKKRIEDLEKRMKQINNNRFQARLKKLTKLSTKRGVCRNDDNNTADIQSMLDNIHEQTRFSGHELNLLYGVLEEAKLTNRHGYDRNLVKKFLDRSSSSHSKLARCMSRGVAYHHAGLISRDRVAVEALYRNRYIQIIFSTSTLCMSHTKYLRMKIYFFSFYSFGYSYANQNCWFCSRFDLS